jgi:DNA-binding Xre family transcriptional regulator
MTAKLDYRWRLRDVMADRGMFSTTDLRAPLTERGIRLSDVQIWRLAAEKPERLNLKVFMALLDILGCRMDELIEPVAAAPARRKAVGEQPADAEPGAGGGVGSFRPKRARIVPDQQ